MDPIEEDEIEALRVHVESEIEKAQHEPWPARQGAASRLLTAASSAWWRVHRSDPSAYERDLARLNEVTGWRDPYQQVAYWYPRHGERMLMPPKFFAGDALALHKRFVASMSLNHAVLPRTRKPFAKELAEQQSEEGAAAAHAAYFSRDYAYARFFRPRGEVLRAYAATIGLPPVGTSDFWRDENRRLAFYVEAFPTRSVRFALPPRRPTQQVLERTVFVCAINSIVHRVVLRLLRPTRVLMAGRASWELWPDSSAAALGDNVSRLVRRYGKCSVFRSRVVGELDGLPTTIVRSNFLRTVHGPNSTAELHRLGSRVLADLGAPK